MAQGDVTLFDDFSAEISNIHDLDADEYRVALITTLPVKTQTTPTLGDYTECSGGGNYTQVGVGSGAAFNGTFVEGGGSAGEAVFDGDNVTWLQDGSNPTNARAALIVNVTNGDAAVGFIDLGATINMSLGDLIININASGLFTLGPAA